MQHTAAAPSQSADARPGGSAGRRLLVPVRPGPAGDTLRICRTALGARTVVAFTSEQRLAAAFGPAQPWIPLGEAALRALAEPLGVHEVTVDPRFSVRRANGGRGNPVGAVLPRPAPAA